jgi:hypothetical protein
LVSHARGDVADGEASHVARFPRASRL